MAAASETEHKMLDGYKKSADHSAARDDPAASAEVKLICP